MIMKEEKIIGNWEYTPREIAKNGFVKNTRGVNASYEYVLWLIRQGLLKARDIREGMPNRQNGDFSHRRYFVVGGSEIERFNKENKFYPQR